VRTGNKMQVAVLSIVALGAVGFLAFQMMPSKLQPLVAVLTPSSSPSSPVVYNDHLPMTLVGNPFSHPALAVKPPATQAAKQGPPAPVDGVVEPISKGGRLPPARDSQQDDSSAPAESAGKDRKQQQGPSLRVAAVVAVGTPIAMIEVAGKDAQSYSPQDLIAPGVRLLKISDSGVIVRDHGTEVQIPVGKPYDPQAKENEG